MGEVIDGAQGLVQSYGVVLGCVFKSRSDNTPLEDCAVREEVIEGEDLLGFDLLQSRSFIIGVFTCNWDYQTQF